MMGMHYRRYDAWGATDIDVIVAGTASSYFCCRSCCFVDCYKTIASLSFLLRHFSRRPDCFSSLRSADPSDFFVHC